jgi:hypothetical protein
LGVLEVPRHSGGLFFSKSRRYGTTAGPEQSSLETELNWLRLSVPAAGGWQTMLIWTLGGRWGPRRLPGGGFFSEYQRYASTAGPMQSSLETELNWLRSSVSCAGGVQTKLIWTLGGPQGPRRLPGGGCFSEYQRYASTAGPMQSWL